MQGKIGSKDPVKQYGSVRGLKVHYGSATDYSTYPEGPFDVVYDNNGKDMDSCKMLIDAAKVSCGLGEVKIVGLECSLHVANMSVDCTCAATTSARQFPCWKRCHHCLQQHQPLCQHQQVMPPCSHIGLVQPRGVGCCQSPLVPTSCGAPSGRGSRPSSAS